MRNHRCAGQKTTFALALTSTSRSLSESLPQSEDCRGEPAPAGHGYLKDTLDACLSFRAARRGALFPRPSWSP
jgi:hypothetical protein